MGVGGIAGWFSSMITGSVLMTWLFNSSRGSLLAVALFHGVLDVVMTSPVTGPLPSVMGALITIAGIAIPFVFGAPIFRGRRVCSGPLPPDIVDCTNSGLRPCSFRSELAVTSKRRSPPNP